MEREEECLVATGPPPRLAFPVGSAENYAWAFLPPLSPSQSLHPPQTFPCVCPDATIPLSKDALGIIHPGFKGAQLLPQLQVVPGEDISGRVNKAGRLKGTWHFQTIATTH